MFVARRIFRKNKLFTNFICTSNVLNCDKPKDENEVENSIRNENKKVKQNTEKEIFPESKIKRARKDALSAEPKHRNSKNFFERLTEKSVKKVAKELGGDIEKTSREIMNYLNEMEISKDSSKAQFLETDYNKEQRMQSPVMAARTFINSESFKIFDSQIMAETESQVKLKIWDDLEAEELKYLSKKSPENCFEEMIVWTEEGKLWQFPIDNDQGMEKEAEISFTEHIFMEQHLEPWCPKKGPLRKFMQLVLIGLSKNHFYTVDEKKAHIDWFRQYFEEKRKLLQELGAMGSAKEPKEIGVSSAEKNT